MTASRISRSGTSKTIANEPEGAAVLQFINAEKDPPPVGPIKRPSWLIGYGRRIAVTDVVVIAVVVFASQTLRFNESARLVLDGFGSVSYWLVSTILSASWVAALAVNGAWDRKILGSGPSEYARVMRSSFYLFGFVAIVSYLASLEIARSYLAIALPLGLFGLIGGRWVWRRLLEEYRLAGSHLSSVLVVGGTHSAAALAARLRSAPSAGYRVAGLCLPGGKIAWGDRGTKSDGFQVVGDLDDVPGAITRCGADMVAIAASESFGPEEVRHLSWRLEGLGIPIALAPALTDVAGPRIHIRPVDGLPLLWVEEPRFRGPKLVAKSMLDAVGSAVLIVLFAPLMAGVAVAIRLSDRGPALFRQERVGINGKLIRMWKFRSMVVDAEARLAAVAAARRNAGNEILFKAKDDPRITGVGRFIRRFSIDELPQLFNVLRGEMSLVGPRPQLPSEVELLGDAARRRLLVKPGMTGLWQVSGRSDLSWEDTVRLDVYYVENWSMAGDLVIMARTLRAVLGSRGAY